MRRGDLPQRERDVHKEVGIVQARCSVVGIVARSLRCAADCVGVLRSG